MPSPLRISALGAALCGLGVAACAGIVGADFGDVHPADDGGTTLIDSGTITPTPDAGTKAPVDSGPVIVPDGGACPTGLTSCDVGGAAQCIDLTSNPDHCHACATECPADPHNVGSAVCTKTMGCTYTCPDAYEICTGGAGCCPIPVVEAGADTGPATTPGIPCAKTTCSPLSGGFCCGANNDTEGDVCGTAATANDLDCDYEFFCGSADQCGAGTVCCYDDNDYDPQGDTNGKSSLCQATCDTNRNFLQFCDPAKTGECLTGTCTAAHTWNGDQGELQTTYYVCQ